MVTTGASDNGAALADRYGRPAPWRRRLLIVAVTVVALTGAGWLVWTIRGQADPAVSSELVSFTVVSDDQATARIDVDLTQQVRATCTVQAFAADHSLVGDYTFTPALETGTRSYEETVHTVREATTVSMLGCTAPGQPRPR